MNKFFKEVVLGLSLCLSGELMAQTDGQPQYTSPDYIEAMSAYNSTVNQNRLVNQLPIDSAASLPIGIVKQIGQTRFIVAIDSGSFRSSNAFCSAFIAIGLPGMKDTMAFAAKNIGINPKGVLSGNIGNSKLMLVSNHRIKFGPKVTMVLKNDGTNYVDWNCNGFQSFHIKGYFEFSNTILEPDSASGDSVVRASFEIQTSDIHNMITAISMEPFRIKNVKDVMFSVTNAVVDMSSSANFPSMPFPQGYVLSEPNNLVAWKGFYAQNITVKLPSEFSSKTNAPTTIQATNLLIDQTGLSGTIGGTNLLTLGNSKMDGGWQFSIDQLSFSFLQNHLTGGSLNGGFTMPHMKDEAPGANFEGLNFTATVNENVNKELDYMFAVSTKNNLTFNAFTAKVDLYNTSQFIVSKINKRLSVACILNGQIAFGTGKLTTAKLAFQDVHINAKTPYITQGTFSYVGNTQNKTMNYPISLNALSLQFNNSTGLAKVYVNAGINFMDSASQGFSGDVGLTLLTKYEANPSDATLPKLKFDKVTISDIQLNVNTQSYALHGLIVFTDNDPIYGQSFGGSLNFSFDVPNIAGTIAGRFGALPGYKYFFVSGQIIIPGTGIPVTSSVRIKGFIGGVSYHMSRNTDYVAAMMPNNAAAQLASYVPNNNVGLGIKAGVTLVYAEENIFNGDFVFSVLFNSSQNGGGLANMNFTGDVFGMTSIADRLNKRYNQVPVGGSGMIDYDFNNSVLQGALAINVALPSISANIMSGFRFSSSTWYVFVGKPSARGYISTMGENISGYFMVGNQLEPPIFSPGTGNADGQSRNNTVLSDGLGFCLGADYTKYIGASFGWDFFSVYANVYFTLGFDLMMIRYAVGFVCPSTNSEPGIKRYYCKGGIHASMGGDVGIKGSINIGGIVQNFDVNILNISGSARLYAEFVKPIYAEGRVNASYDILGGVVKGSFGFNFSGGTKCE